MAIAMAVMNVGTYGFTLVAARMLGPKEYGAVAALMGLLLVVNVLSVGLQATGARQVAADPSHRERIENRILVTARRSAWALGLLCLVLSPLVTLALVSFGLVMVYSATSASAALGDGDPMSFLKRQAVYALLGVVAMTALARFDYHRLRHLALPLLLVVLGLLAAVLAMAPEINGARRWFLLGPASFQPSELAKLSLCLFAAAYLARRPAPRTLGQLIRPLGLVTAAFCGLILLEPDLGTTISLCLMVLAILLVAAVPVRLLLAATVLAAVRLGGLTLAGEE